MADDIKNSDALAATHWRVKFRVEKRKGGGTPKAPDHATQARRQAEQSHKERWLVCELHRADNINAPLKFFKELARIQKVYVEHPRACAVFWSHVTDAITGLLTNLTIEFTPDAARRVMGEIEKVVERVALTPSLMPPPRTVAGPTLYPKKARPQIDPMLKRYALKLADEDTSDK